MNHGEDRGKQDPGHSFRQQYRPICTTYWRFAAQLDCVHPGRRLKSKVTSKRDGNSEGRLRMAIGKVYLTRLPRTHRSDLAAEPRRRLNRCTRSDI
jgi:hypothetical protein